jgi:hypothetical protein
MVITDPESALEEWHNLPSPPPTLRPDRVDSAKEKVAITHIGKNCSSGSSLSNTLNEDDLPDWETTTHTERYWDGGAESAHAIDVDAIASKLHVDLQ